MHEKLLLVTTEMANRLIGFFPKLLSGVVLLGVGWLLAWAAKRLVIHVSVILKLDRILGLSKWKAAFEKADVRYGFYNFLGNIISVVIFLTFLDFAMIAWELKFISDNLENAILLFPRFAASIAIFGLGWLIARWSADALNRMMSAEDIPNASFIANYAKIMLIVFFAAMSLRQLGIAGEIVMIGFSTIFVTLGLIAVILAASSRSFFSRKENSDNPKDE